MSRPILVVLLAASILAMMNTPSIAQSAAADPTALDLLDAPVSYRADFFLKVEGEAGRYEGEVHHRPGRHRRDVTTAQGRQVFLFRRDSDQAVMMLPDRNWYLALSFRAVSALVGGAETMVVTRGKGVADRVAGEAVTRYPTQASSPKGGQFKGDTWFTRDGIMVKMAGVVRYDNRDTRFETALTSLRRGPVAADVFEVPKDYKGLSLLGMDLERMGAMVEGLRRMGQGKGQ